MNQLVNAEDDEVPDLEDEEPSSDEDDGVPALVAPAAAPGLFQMLQRGLEGLEPIGAVMPRMMQAWVDMGGDEQQLLQEQPPAPGQKSGNLLHIAVLYGNLEGREWCGDNPSVISWFD